MFRILCFAIFLGLGSSVLFGLKVNGLSNYKLLRGFHHSKHACCQNRCMVCRSAGFWNNFGWNVSPIVAEQSCHPMKAVSQFLRTPRRSLVPQKRREVGEGFAKSGECRRQLSGNWCILRVSLGRS